jgi:hypothetical protein
MEPVTPSQLRAAILELKTEVIESLHATEARILARLDGAVTTLDRRVATGERECASCRASMEARVTALENGNYAPRSEHGSAARGGVWTDPKFYVAIALGVGALVWYLVERLAPLLAP